MKLSPTSRKLLNQLCESAMHWGWQQDYGTGSKVKTSEKSYEDARAKLALRLIKLEKKCKNS